VLAQPAIVNRVLRSIDFEERGLGNNESLPMHWSKARGPTLPFYVNGYLTTDRAHSGKYSFRFDLNGGSLIYRYDPGQIKVMVGAHYRVECYVATTPMQRARARLTAYLTDLDGHPILSSVVHSAPYSASSASEGWKKLSIEVAADDPNAAFLVIELGLLQPNMYAQTSLGDRALFTQDINGSAWFDDITVSQIPQVEISTDKPGNIFKRGESPRLNVLVNDRFTDDLAAQLIVRDATGANVYQRSGGLDMASAQRIGPGQKRMTLVLPNDLEPGWYEASLVMNSNGVLVGDQKVDFILLADDGAAVPDPRFGMIATSLPFAGWSELPDILPFLGAGRVKLAVWSKAGNIQQMDSGAFDQLLSRLSELNITPTACLLSLPPDVAEHVGTDQWTGILRASDELWQPELAFMISRHANHLDRWQLGDDGSDAFVTNPAMRTVYSRVYSEFASLMDKPDLAMPWPSWYEMQGELPATVALSVPPSVLPSQIPLYMQELKGKEGHNLSLSLQLLDADKYGRELQISDLAQRVIYALSADATRIDLPLPYSVDHAGNDVVKEPGELMMIMRTLITTLGGTTYRGQVPVADGVDAFLFDKNGVGILALWDRGSDTSVKQLVLNTGSRPMRVDLWGNATPLVASANDQSEGAIRLNIGPMPIFLIDIDGSLAQLRASVHFDNNLIESSFEPHNRHIRFTNSYKQSISGTFKLRPPPGWTITPPTFAFNLNPGETFDREVQIEFPYNSLGGTKEIAADFTVQADRSASFSVPVPLKLGLSDVGMQALAIRDGKDVVVQQVISNYGEKPIDYTAFAVFPGQARQERLVTQLGPGRTTIKRYRFNSVDLSTETKVRVGVKELLGTRILNAEVGVQ
jgi:hypothetical protein